MKINLWFSAGRLNPYFNISYDKKLENDDIKADDFEKSLLANIPYVYRNIDLYREALENEDFKYFEKLIDAYKFDDKLFEIYYVCGTEMERMHCQLVCVILRTILNLILLSTNQILPPSAKDDNNSTAANVKSISESSLNQMFSRDSVVYLP